MVDRSILIAAGVVGTLVVAAAVSWWMSRSYADTLYQSTITKGLNGFSGDVLSLSCPLGQVISFPNTNPTTTRGAIVCQGNPSCDAFYIPQTGQATSFYSTNIIDVLRNLSYFPELAGCVGKQECTFTVPTASQLPAIGAPCVKACTGQLSYQGTYQCGPA